MTGYAAVDPADAERLSEFCWQLQKARSGLVYAIRYFRVDGRKHSRLMHRQILGLTDRRIEADHMNHDGLDNRRSNLRVVVHAQNHQNRRSASGATSRHRGVHWNAESGKWRAEARLNSRSHHLGYFSDELEAARAVSDWRLEHMPFAIEVAI